MPGGNGTGPAGMGPMTGRAAGHCAGYPVAGYLNPFGAKPGFGGRIGNLARGMLRPFANRYIGQGFNRASAGAYRPLGRPSGFGLSRGRAGRGRRR